MLMRSVVPPPLLEWVIRRHVEHKGKVQYSLNFPPELEGISVFLFLFHFYLNLHATILERVNLVKAGPPQTIE